MLTFLRKIRRSLINFGSIGKYTIYAIGEIVLVVIGILIALQVNNWNNEQAEIIREQDYLTALKSDFLETKSVFETNKWEHSLVKSAMEQILDWAEDGIVPQDDHLKFDSLLSNVFWRSSFDPPLGTIETILGSGNVGLIKNKNLVSLLTQWKSIVDSYKADELRAVDHFYQTIYPFLTKKLSLQDMDKSIPREVPWHHGITNGHQLIKNQEFHNIIYVHWVIQWNLEDFKAPEVDSTIMKVLSLIEPMQNN
jgi:hypothetical protein